MPSTYTLTLPNGIGTITVSMTHAPPYDISQNDTLKRYLREAFAYICQSEMGAAILKTLITGANGRVNILFFNGGSCFNPDGNLVKWNPRQICWFADCTKDRYLTRPQNKDSNLIDQTRPQNIVYTPKPSPYLVAGFSSPPALLLHELGHLVQSLTRRHLFTEAQNLANRNMKHLIPGTDIEIDDLEWPLEVENNSRHERPFIQDLWKKGLCEGIRWHYQHSIFMQGITDWRTQTLWDSGELISVIRYTVEGFNKECTQSFWGVEKVGFKVKKTYLKDYSKAEKRIIGRYNRLPLPEDVWHSKFNLKRE